MHQTPVGPWDREKPVAKATLEALNAKFGLNKPVWVMSQQFGTLEQVGNAIHCAIRSPFWTASISAISGGLVRLDLGPSYRSKGTESVQSILWRKFPTTAKVGLVATAFAVVVGIPLGVLGALRQNSWIDYLSLTVATLGVSVPSFVIGVLVVIGLSQLFGVKPIRAPEEWRGFSAAYLRPVSSSA
jgi:oligopeptide transport system permease protein